MSRRRITAPHLSHRLTDAFEDFMRSLKGEGVHVPTERQPPRPPITVVPIPERIEYDIEIPRTGPSLERSHKRVQDFDPTTADSIFDVGDIGRLRALRMKAEGRQHTVCEKTVFNYVATFNAFETEFAELLETCEDVSRFAALAEFFTGFWVDYVKPSGATGRYFPDWVVVQKLDEGEGQLDR